MRVAAVAWEIREIEHEDQFFDHLMGLIAQTEGADLVVLPELVVLELMSLHPDAPADETAGILGDYADRYEEALGSFGVTIVGGSHIRGNRNVCLTDGVLQPKNVLTQWEAVEWRLDAGAWLFLPPDPRVGVTICYDVEFPAAGRALAEAGVLVHCVPAYTETRRGFQRVRWSCHARAIENQVFVVHASLVGSLGREPVPSTYGTSAILCPSVEPFPESAILAETTLGQEGVAFADLDFEALLASRRQGDVRNWEDRERGDWRVIPA